MGDLCVAATVKAFLRDDREHAVSSLKPAFGRRHLDLAAHLGSWHERQIRLDLVSSANLEQVKEVHSRRAHSDSHQPFGRLRGLDIFESELLGCP